MVLEAAIGRYLDSLLVSSFHRKAFWLIALGLLFDGFDLYLAGGVTADLVKNHWTTTGGISYFVSFTFLGLLIGSLLAGFTGDKFGRGMMYRFNLLVFGLASIAAALSTNYTMVVVFRFIQGIGLGAEIVLGYATFGEFIPPAIRGKWNSLLALFTNGALFLAALAASLVIPRFGWRIMFWIVGIPALIVWWFRRALPESPRWLASRGRTDEVLAILNTIGDRQVTLDELTRLAQSSSKTDAVGHGRFADLFNRKLASRTIFTMILLIVLNIGVYGFNTWLPAVLVKERGLSIAKSLSMTVVVSAGSIVGAVVTSFFSDRLSSKKYITTISLLVAACGILFASMHSNSGLMWSGFLFQSCLYCFVVMAWAVYIPAVFPTNVRLRGTGLANAAGRFAVVVVPYIISGVLAAYGFIGVVWGIVLLFVLTAFLTIWIGVDVQGRSLEELNFVAPTVEM